MKAKSGKSDAGTSAWVLGKIENLIVDQLKPIDKRFNPETGSALKADGFDPAVFAALTALEEARTKVAFAKQVLQDYSES